ncbi:MAG: helix-turn-helix domain-containing protein [Oscillospiraceae bacterium]|nr:helix-turn-helix domain-containing protein [Oscillospiraceae bacterium]
MTKLAAYELSSLGGRVRQCRYALGYTQEKLAELLKTNTKAIIHIERNASVPEPEMLQALAAILKTDPEWLLYGDPAHMPDNGSLPRIYRRKLAELQQYLHVTQTRFAKDCGISRPCMSQCLSGARKVTMYILQKVCQAYGLRMDYFTANLPLKDAFINGEPILPVQLDREEKTENHI